MEPFLVLCFSIILTKTKQVDELCDAVDFNLLYDRILLLFLWLNGIRMLLNHYRQNYSEI